MTSSRRIADKIATDIIAQVEATTFSQEEVGWNIECEKAAYGNDFNDGDCKQRLARGLEIVKGDVYPFIIQILIEQIKNRRQVQGLMEIMACATHALAALANPPK